MEINILQAILIGITYYLGTNGTPWLTGPGSIGWMRPMVNGLIVGLIMGDPVQGTIIGTAINLPYMAFITAGGTVPMDPAFAGTVGTALALATGTSPAVAITLAVPVGLLGTIIWNIHMLVDNVFVHMSDTAAENGDIDRINFLHVVPPQLIMALISVIPAALVVYLGGDVLQSVLNLLEGRPMQIMALIGGILPALGIAMNLRAMDSDGTVIFFIFGFLLAVYSGLPILAVSIFAAVIAWIYTTLTTNGGNDDNQNDQTVEEEAL